MTLFDLFFGDQEKFWKRLEERMEKSGKQNTTKETFEVKKGDYNHKFTYWFDEQGNIVGSAEDSTLIPSKEEEKENLNQLLQKQINEAVAQEDYEKASELKKQLMQFKTN